MTEPAEESAAQLVARVVSACRPQINILDSKIFPNHGPFPKEIVEISGDVGAGKTTLLMHIMAKTILPIECGGKDGRVVFILTEHNSFDSNKFDCVLEKCIGDGTTSNAQSEMISALNEQTLLQNFTIIRCFDEIQLELAIYNLDQLLSESNRYCLLALDNIGAFYYTSSKAEKKGGYSAYMKDVLNRLRRVINDYHLVLVYTKPAYFVQKSSSSNRMDNVNYFMELIDGAGCEAEDGDLVYRVDIPRTNRVFSRKYEFDVDGCIEWKE